MGSVVGVCERKEYPAVIVTGAECSERDDVLRELERVLRSFYDGLGYSFPTSPSKIGESRWKRPKRYFFVTDSKRRRTTRVTVEERRDGKRTLSEDPNRDYAASILTRYSPCFAVYFDSQRGEKFFRGRMESSDEQESLDDKVVDLNCGREEVSYIQRNMFRSYLESQLTSARMRGVR
jgi:hypothetical protein